MVIQPLILLASLFVIIVAASLLSVALYVTGSYLIYAYDRRLARSGHLHPPHDELGELPKGWDRARGLLLEIYATYAIVALFPFGKIGYRSIQKAAKGRGCRPILLIHGYNLNRSCWAKFRRALKEAGLGPIYTLNLPRRSGGLPGLACAIKEEAERIERETGVKELILIGHSMGGLVSAFYAERLATAGSVSHVITLGSPLHGTRSAVFTSCIIGRQMHVGSDFVKDLSHSIMINRKVRYHHVASQFDNIILPFQSALIGRDLDCELLLSDIGHNSLLFSPRVTSQVVEWLKRSAPAMQQEGRSRALPCALSPTPSQNAK